MTKIVYLNNNNMFQINKTQQKYLNDDSKQSIIDGIQKLYTDSERRVCEYGNFRKVKILIKNKDKDSSIKTIELSIRPSMLLKDRPKERELTVTASSGLEKYSIVLVRGEKDNILKALSDEKFIEKIDNFLLNAQDELKHI